MIDKIHYRLLGRQLSGSFRDALTKAENRQQKQLLRDIFKLARERHEGQAAGAAQTDRISGFISSNMRHMTTGFLDTAERAAMSSGLAALAYAIRHQNETFVLHNAHRKEFVAEHNAVKLFWIYLKHDDESAIKMLLKCANVERNPETYEKIRYLCSSFGMLPKDISILSSNPGHAAFAEYVKGKRIAVIGPSSSGTDISAEIKHNFGITVRMNYRGRGSLPETQQELPPQISYYRLSMNGVFANPDEDISYLSDLDFAVLKKKNSSALDRMLGYTNTREKIYRRGFLFSGSFHLLQLALHDLLHFEPACIKVFNSNCYLSEKSHDEGYYPGGAAPDIYTLWNQHARHSLISQYDYINRLYKRGLIEADGYLSQVLELGTAEYMRRIDGQEGRKNLTKA